MRLVKILILTGLCAFFSCKKYEEGPMISFRSKKARVVGIWSLAYARMFDPTAQRNYTDEQNIYRDSLEALTYEFSNVNNFFAYGEDGESVVTNVDWNFDSRKENIVLNRVNGIVQIMPINKLFNNEMKLVWKVRDTISVEMSFNQ